MIPKLYNDSLVEYKLMKDEDIVELVRGGDSSALDYLIMKYRKFVRAKSAPYFLVGGDRDDIFQEGMIGLFKAIRDYDRGELIGTKTFGKGIVQRISELPTKDGSALKLTISEYFTPNGTNIHGIGIEPDIVVELPEDIKSIGVENLKEDTQLQKALEVIKGKIK